MVDALSDYAFFDSGAVKTPVVATDAAGPFLENGVEDFWLYYCVQGVGVANRFVAMPSTRNRVIAASCSLGCEGVPALGLQLLYNS